MGLYLVGHVVLKAAGVGAGFQLEDEIDGAMILILESGDVAAKELKRVAVGRVDPGAEEGSDFVIAGGGCGERVFRFLIDLVVEISGLDHDEAFETPIEGGEFFDEAEVEGGAGAELGDGGAEGGLVLIGVLDVEDGVGGGGEAVLEGSTGAFEFAFGGDGASGFGAVDSGLFGASGFGVGRDVGELELGHGAWTSG